MAPCVWVLRPASWCPGTKAHAAYGAEVIHERHRHRYEVNNDYREALVKAGLVISGTTLDDQLVEIIELPDHPWFVACQFHPEFKSRPTRPHPLFRDFVGAAVALSKQRAKSRGTSGGARPCSPSRLASGFPSLFVMLGQHPQPVTTRESSCRRDHRAARGVWASGRYRGRHGEAIGGDCGNLVCTVGSEAAAPCLALGAHMDTVMPAAATSTRCLDAEGRFTNRNDGILGADDKAAIAALLHAAELLVQQRGAFPHVRAVLHRLRRERAGGGEASG